MRNEFYDREGAYRHFPWAHKIGWPSEEQKAALAKPFGRDNYPAAAMTVRGPAADSISRASGRERNMRVLTSVSFMKQVFTVNLDFGAAPLAEEDAVASLDVRKHTLAALITRTGPTATTTPSDGFSFTVSGMMMPPFVFSSPSRRRMTR
jgi:hypothetical protein